MAATQSRRQVSAPHKPDAPAKGCPASRPYKPEALAKGRPSLALQACAYLLVTAGVGLFTGALATAQTPGSADWSLVPRLSRGQEFIYSGSYAEEITGPTVQYTHAYRLESRVFVLETSRVSSDAAFLTILRPKAAGSDGNSGQIEPSSVRLELATVDAHGRVGSDAVDLSTPLDGAPVLETGVFVEMPGERVRLGQTWEVMGNGRPPSAWKVAGKEDVNGAPCIKLEGVQQSDDWDKPRADMTAWRRRDTVWLAPGFGIAMKFERVIEHREPLRRDPNRQLVTSYVLDSRVQYPGQLYEDRKREILLAQSLTSKAKLLLREPERTGRPAFEEILARINHHMDNQPTTPYRESLVQLKRRMEAALRGDFPQTVAEEAPPMAPVIALGQPAPDFVSTELGTQESARLRRLLGKPIVLVFYSPTSRTAGDLLSFAQSLWIAHKDEIKVIGLAVADDTAAVLKQRDEMHLTFPILSGRGLRVTYAVDATPKLVVLDAKGVVRGAYVGWGKETPTLVADELKNWIRAAAQK